MRSYLLSDEKGFTLIELLIVVAIIAILAAIAVPNFLEAQVRSKVSRVYSDMRSMATAMEAYMVDYNSYPSQYASGTQNPGDNYKYAGPLSAAVALSTPVAYITNPQIRDPFALNLKEDDNPTNIQVGTGNDGNKQLTLTMSGRNDPIVGGGVFPSNCFVIMSVGPDRDDQTGLNGYPWVKGITYDGTNGTRSEGDVYRNSKRVPKGYILPLSKSQARALDDPWL